MQIKAFYKSIAYISFLSLLLTGLEAQSNDQFDFQISKEVVDNLVDEGLLDRDYCNARCCNYLYQILDVYFTTNYAKHKVIGKIELLRIIKNLKDLKLTSTTVNTVLDNYQLNPNDIKKDSLLSILKVAAFKDQLNNIETKKKIANSLRICPYGFKNYNETYDKFLNQKISLPEFIDDIKYLKKMSYDTLRTDKEFFAKIKQIFHLAFEEYNIDLEYTSEGSTVTVATPTSSYEILKSNLVSPYSTVSNNSILADGSFYFTLIPIISQVSADVNLDLIVGFRDMSEIFHDNLLSAELNYVNNTFNGGFLQCIPRNEFEKINWKEIFNFSPDYYCRDILSFMPLYLPSERKDYYISRESKIKYYEFVATYLNGSNELISEELKTIRLNSPMGLASFLERNNGFKYTECQNSLGMDHYFPEGKICDLENCTPKLFKFFDFEFNLKNISIQKGKLKFEYKNKEYSCYAYATRFWKEISTIFQKENRDKQIYFISDYLESCYHYFYLTEGEKVDLESIFKRKLQLLNKIDGNNRKRNR